MRYDILIVVNDQKTVITMEGDCKELCDQLRKSICAVIGNQVENLQVLEVKES